MGIFKQTTTTGQTHSSKSNMAFFALVFLFSIPFWVIGSLTEFQLLPGLPLDSLIFVCPGLAALILVFREDGTKGVSDFLKRSFDYKRITAKVWYAPVLLLMPFVMVLSFVVMRLSGSNVPVPQINVFSALILSLLFFLAALGEELGWSGYAIDPMQHRLGALNASIVLGMIWAMLHYIGLLHAHRSVVWIVWWSLGTVSLRVIMVWLYYNIGKSVFAMALFHMMVNVTWQLYPVNGSYYDPRVTGLILAMVAVIIIFAMGPRTMLRNEK